MGIMRERDTGYTGRTGSRNDGLRCDESWIYSEIFDTMPQTPCFSKKTANVIIGVHKRRSLPFTNNFFSASSLSDKISSV